MLGLRRGLRRLSSASPITLAACVGFVGAGAPACRRVRHGLRLGLFLHAAEQHHPFAMHAQRALHRPLQFVVLSSQQRIRREGMADLAAEARRTLFGDFVQDAAALRAAQPRGTTQLAGTRAPWVSPVRRYLLPGSGGEESAVSCLAAPAPVFSAAPPCPQPATQWSTIMRQRVARHLRQHIASSGS